jgi:L-rhamnose-H+ transport protein
MSTLQGALVVALAGLLTGSGAWPMKVVRKFQFEHCWFVGMLVGLIALPWAVTLALCPHPFAAYGALDLSLILKANLFSLAWGVANLLCGLCFVRIGFALTGGILTGLGISVGVTVPMIVKGSGRFSAAPSLNSAAGHAVLLGVAILLAGVVLVTLAGFGRDRALRKLEQPSGAFGMGLLMVVVAGVLSVGMSFAFVYCQSPIVAAMKAQGAGDIPANFAVWAIALLGGALINVLYPAYLITRNRSWQVLTHSPAEFALAGLIGVGLFAGAALLGKGMLLLGALGASVGFGIQQAAQMLGNQGVGFLGGEWRGVSGTPRLQMYIAICILIISVIILGYANTLARS